MIILLLHLGSCVHGFFLKSKHSDNLGTTLKVWVALTVVLASVLFFHTNKIKWLGFELYHIPSRSMEPTLNIGDIVLVDTWVKNSEFSANDVVVFQKQLNGLILIKRIKDLRRTGIHTEEIFVTGDNSALSMDSRHFGWVPTSHVVGIARAKLFSIKSASYDLYEYPTAL